MDRGIDYSLGSGVNSDLTNGIHYGVISMNALNEWAWESVEADYGGPTCPKCGGPAVTWDGEEHDHYLGLPNWRGEVICCCEYACESCHLAFDTEDVYGDEPIGHVLDDGQYKGVVDSYNDLFVMKSPYYTHAGYCSPCAPGACHLEHPVDESGPKAYCLGPDWFEDEAAPYDVYSVETGERIHKGTKGD